MGIGHRVHCVREDRVEVLCGCTTPGRRRSGGAGRATARGGASISPSTRTSTSCSTASPSLMSLSVVVAAANGNAPKGWYLRALSPRVGEPQWLRLPRVGYRNRRRVGGGSALGRVSARPRGAGRGRVRSQSRNHRRGLLPRRMPRLRGPGRGPRRASGPTWSAIKHYAPATLGRAAGACLCGSLERARPAPPPALT